MLDFFTKTLSGITYIVVVVICIILILALIGVIDELKYKDTIKKPPKEKKVTKNEESTNVIQTIQNMDQQQANAPTTVVPTIPTSQGK